MSCLVLALKNCFDSTTPLFVGGEYDITLKYRTDYSGKKPKLYATALLVHKEEVNGVKSGMRIRNEHDVHIFEDFLQNLVKCYGKK